MAKRKTWKIAVAVFAVVIAGIVYCVLFAEEKEKTVHYQTGEEDTGNAVNLSADTIDYTGAQVGNGTEKQNDGVMQYNGKGNTTAQKPEKTGAVVQSDSAKLVYVHVCGAVKNPAVYSLPEGSRVCDAIAKAGGLTENAADDYVNQARFLSDGERVYIPEEDELSDLSASQYAAGQPIVSVGSSQNGNSTLNGNQGSFPVNINTAGVSELTTLPGIGESRAESIIAYREINGTFARIEDIMKINGIKDAAYEKIKDKICTGNE